MPVLARWSRRYRFSSILVCLLAAISAHPQKPHRNVTFPEFAHSTWSSRDGAPTDINTLAQTADGLLWIGTPLGLHRFDGLAFSTFPASSADPDLPGRAVSALAADGKEGLWIGFEHGGLAHLVGRTVTRVVMPQPQTNNPVDGLACCYMQSLWVMTGETILRWNGRLWEDFGASHGLPRTDFFTLFQDRDGNLWTASTHHVYELRSGGARFIQVSTEHYAITQFVQTADGTIWVSEAWKSLRPLRNDCSRATVPLPGVAAETFDGAGNLWIAYDNAGVARLSHFGDGCRHPPRIEHFTTQDGLTANETRGILRDRDGNIWVGTELGLDRFRPQAFTSVLEGRFSFYPALAFAPDGSMFAEGHGMALQHVSASASTGLSQRLGSSPIAVDRRGDVWLVDPWRHRLDRIDPKSGAEQVFAVPAPFTETAAQQVAVLPDGSVLVAFEEHGLWEFHDGRWSLFRSPGMPDDTPTALNANGPDLRIGYTDDRIYESNGQRMSSYGQADGLLVGTVLATKTDANGTLWIAGSEGVAYQQGGRFVSLLCVNPELTKGTSGIAFDSEGNLWLNSGAGVARIPKGQIDAARQDHSHRAIALLFGDADGVMGTPAQAKPVPTIVMDGEGQLWIARSGHILVASPLAFKRQRAAPQMTIEAVLIDGRPVVFGKQSGSGVQLQGGRDNKVEIDYAGVDLSNPAQIVYRYKLEGSDSHWQEAGRSRQAVYAALRPGSYRFQVAATNDGEHWTELSSALALTVVPAFFQTTWFLVICLLAALVLLWTMYMMRIRYVTTRVRDRLEQRNNERLRIARELHDTLLQSIHGLMLRFDVATEQLEESHPVRPLLKVALQRADSLLIEGRNRVHDLRGEADRSQPLAELLASIAKDLQTENTPPIHIEEEGAPRLLLPLVREELCNISRECLVNSLQHSGATAIEIEISFGATAFRLLCRDNGRGISDAVLKAGGRSGHWGLRGIEERARNIGATPRIWSKPGRGTEIEIRLRAVSAYVSPRALAKLQFWNR